jgi:hypothetical protein
MDGIKKNKISTPPRCDNFLRHQSQDFFCKALVGKVFIIQSF